MDPVDIISYIKNIPQFKQKSQEWLNQRLRYLTSSNSGSVLQINKYNSMAQKMLEMLLPPAYEESDATRHGNQFEQEAIDLFCVAMGYVNFDFGLIPYEEINYRNSERDPSLNFLAGSPDGIVIDPNDLTMKPRVIEIKCPYNRMIKAGDSCPIYYVPQLLLNMEILDLDVGYFIEYIPKNFRGNSDFIMNVIEMRRSDDFLKKNKEQLVLFWKTLQIYKKIGAKYHPLFDNSK